MARRASTSTYYVDWFNVTYRSVFTFAGIALAAVAAAAGYWYYANVYKPKTASIAAIEQASGAHRQARGFDVDGELAKHVKRAGDALNEARGDFDAHRYRDAQFSALHSLDLSRKVIEVVGGQESRGYNVRFYRLEGDVRVKKAGEFSWENADASMELRAGDQVKTSSNGSAQVIYFDGTVTTVERGSLLEIRELYEDPVTKVRRVEERVEFGAARASIQDRNVDGSYHALSTAQNSARADRAAELQVSYDKNARTAKYSLYSGEAQVYSAGRTENLKAGERIVADARGRLGARQMLPGVPRLRSPADERVYVFSNPSQAKVTLAWEPLPSANSYHLMIANQRLFTEPLFQGDREGEAVPLEGLTPGTYFWKVAANRDAVRGQFSPVRTFRISTQRIQDDADTVPPRLEVADFVPIGGMVIVNGQAEPGAKLWIDNERVDVFDDGSFNAVIRLQSDGLNEIVFVAQDGAGNETRTVRNAYAEAP